MGSGEPTLTMFGWSGIPHHILRWNGRTWHTGRHRHSRVQHCRLGNRRTFSTFGPLVRRGRFCSRMGALGLSGFRYVTAPERNLGKRCKQCLRGGRRRTILVWNGSAWSSSFIGHDTGPSDIWGSGAIASGQLEATGQSYSGMVVHGLRNPLALHSLHGIWGADARNVWAVGSANAVLKWDGNAWTPQTPAWGFSNIGVWGTDANHVWVVGMGGLIAGVER